MKRLFSILCAVGLASAAFAVEPVVEIRDSGNTYLDGVNAGQPADVIANNPALAPAVNRALVAFVAKTKTDAAAAKDDAIAAIGAEKDAKLAALRLLLTRAGYDPDALLAAGPDALKNAPKPNL